MAGERPWDKLNAVLEKPVAAVQWLVNFFMRDGTLAALGREAIKDVQDTFHEAAWGNSGHGHEPGGPLTPLYMDIANARDQYQQENTTVSLPSPSQIARGDSRSSATVHGHGHEASPSHTLSPSEIAKDRGSVHGRGNAQLAQVEVFMSQDVPMPEPVPEAAPMPEPMPEGNATQGQAPKPGSFAARELERRANNEGGNDQNALGRGRSLPDEQRQQREEQDKGRSR